LVLDEYHATELVRKNLQSLKQIRDAVAFVEARNYRGISREPLMPWSSIDERLLQRGVPTRVDLRREQTARRRFLEMVGEDREEWDHYVFGVDYNKALISSLRIARELYGVLDKPEDWEIVELARETYGTDYDVVGFDIGYWGSDNFSLICDTVVTPRWHPPAEEDLAELAQRLRGLNRHVLLPSADAAAAFREYYTSRPWAEEDVGPVESFCIVQVAVTQT
jgi:hypothetical protein